jgi:membrane protein implicated in regulation of membrane protease activity
MTWAAFYLVCFVMGLALSVLMFLTGGVRWHLPFHMHMHLPHGGPAHTGGVGHGPAAHGPAHGAANGAGTHGAPISPFNFFTFTVFLAWFGGTGYLLTHYYDVWFWSGLGFAVLSGVVGGAIVYGFLAKVLMSRNENLDPEDYDMVGVLGRVCSPIRQGGTGEIIYSQAGTRRVCGARSEKDEAIAKGTEVVVTRYERGIAYVRLWDEISGDAQFKTAAGPETK